MLDHEVVAHDLREHQDATEAERQVYLELVPLVDHAMLYRMTHPKVPREHFAARTTAVDELDGLTLDLDRARVQRTGGERAESPQ